MSVTQVLARIDITILAIGIEGKLTSDIATTGTGLRKSEPSHYNFK